MVDFLTQAIFSKGLSEIADRIIGENKEESDKTKNVVVVKNPDSYSLTLLDRAETTQQKISKPNLSFDNPLGTQDSIIHEISLIPTELNKEKINCLVTIEDIPFFKTKVGGFTDLSDTIIKIPNGKRIKSKDSVKVFFWNEIDDTIVGMTVQITFGE